MESPPEPSQPQPADAPVAEIPEGYFPREYVEKLRASEAATRARFAPFEQTFADFDDDDREAWLTLAKMSKDEDPNVRKQLAEQMGFALPPDESPQYMTRQDFEKELGQYQAQQAQQTAINDVYRQAESLGYTRDTEPMVRLLWNLNQMDTPDIKAADAAVKAYDQKVIADYIAAKGAQGGVPIQPTAQGQPAKEYVPPKTPKQAHDAAQARFANSNRNL